MLGLLKVIATFPEISWRKIEGVVVVSCIKLYIVVGVKKKKEMNIILRRTTSGWV
jgi:hypothetical protein